MVQGRGCARFLLEPPHAVLAPRELGGKNPVVRKHRVGCQQSFCLWIRVQYTPARALSLKDSSRDDQKRAADRDCVFEEGD